MGLGGGEGGGGVFRRGGGGGGEVWGEARGALESLVGAAAQALQGSLGRGEALGAGLIGFEGLVRLVEEGALLAEALALESAEPMGAGGFGAAGEVAEAVALGFFDAEVAGFAEVAGVVPALEPGGVEGGGGLRALEFEGGEGFVVAALEGEAAEAAFFENGVFCGGGGGGGGGEGLEQAEGAAGGEVSRRRVIRSHV